MAEERFETPAQGSVMAGFTLPDGARPASVWEELHGPVEARVCTMIADLQATQEPLGDVLAGLHEDPESLDFTRKLFGLVGSTDDAFASALGLREMAHEVPSSMRTRDRLAMRAGGIASLGLPWAVMPMVRRWMRDRVAHLVLAAKLPSGTGGTGGLSSGLSSALGAGRLSALSEAMKRIAERGFVPVVRPLGDGVHGERGAEAEAARLVALIAHPAVQHIVVDPARLAPGGDDWTTDADIDRAAHALRPVFAAAAEHGTTVHLEPASVRWARLMPAVLERGLADSALDRARVGTRLFVDLPDSRELYAHLSRWAQRRVADGGAPAEVVLGVSTLAGVERITALMTGLPVPVIEDRDTLTAQYLRLVELAITPGRAAVLRPVCTSEDVSVLAAVAELAQLRGVRELVSVQLRAGIAPGLAEMLHGSYAEVRIVQPVSDPHEFGGAVDLLIGVAAELADPASSLARLQALMEQEPLQMPAKGGDGADPAPISDSAGADDAPAEDPGLELLLREREHMREIMMAAAEPAPTSHRTQQRATEWDPTERDSALFYRAPDEPSRFDTGGLTAAVLGLRRGSTGGFALDSFVPARAIPVVSASGFACEPETDASVPENRGWAREQLRHAALAATSRDAANDTVALSPADIDPAAAAEAAREAGAVWAGQRPQQRAARLRRAALATVAARDRLLQLLAAETGAPVREIDAEINDIVDAARYCGQLAEGLAAVRGAEFVPDTLTLVSGGTIEPLSTQAAEVLAALAAGSGVLWSVPQRLIGTARALVEEWEVGGITPGVVHLEALASDRTLGDLAAHPSIDRAVVLGQQSTAHELSRRRPDLRIEGRLAAQASMLVTPSADLDQAITDVVASAFRGAGAHPRAIHTVVLLGSTARSRRFRDGLADAVRALRVGDTARASTADPLSFEVGPLAAPPTQAQLRALTELARGEEWLVQPVQLDDAGLLWSPGVRANVHDDATFWADAQGVPVLGLTHAHTMAEAIALQNGPATGAVAGLQANDEDEVAEWLDAVEAASLAINTPTTAARVERQPGGGWNDAAIGLPALSGGPNWLFALGSWKARPGTRSETLHLRGLDAEVQLLIETAQEHIGYEEFDALRRAALSDALAWRTSFGVVRDTIGLGVERNVMRYTPVRTHVRLAEGGPIAALLRVVAAALLVRAPIDVSTGEVLPPRVLELLAKLGVEVSLEHDEGWVERLAAEGPVGADDVRAARVRLIGGDRVRVAEWMGGLDREPLWADPVTMAGPVELLTFLREQAVTARAHRHGLAIAAPGLDELIAG